MSQYNLKKRIIKMNSFSPARPKMLSEIKPVLQQTMLKQKFKNTERDAINNTPRFVKLTSSRKTSKSPSRPSALKHQKTEGNVTAFESRNK